MAEKNKMNAVCAICGREYYMCLSCEEHRKLNPWKRYTDTSEHYKIFQILHGVTIGVYDKEEAKSKLLTVDLSDKETFKDNILKKINDILKEDTKHVEVPAEELNEENVAEKPKYIRKRKQPDVVEVE